MKKSWLIRALLLTAYCVPFAFFSVKGDITSGTMVYYGVMIVSFVILYRCALKTDNVPIIFIGNILSFFLFDGKAVAVRPDGMVLQAVYIPLSDCRDIGRVPHHPCDHRMEKRQKAEERTGV
mgnify:CR=1 FL=1